MIYLYLQENGIEWHEKAVNPNSNMIHVNFKDFEDLPTFAESIMVPFCAESMLGGK